MEGRLVLENPAVLVWVLLFFGMAGSVMGSFACCYVHRYVKDESVIRGRSVCDQCGHVLGVWDLVPLISYLCLRGRCRYCGHKISSASFWAEVLCAGVFMILGYRFGVTMRTFQYMILAVLLVIVSFVDLSVYIIPDCCILGMLVNWAMFLPLQENWIAMLPGSLFASVFLYCILYSLSKIVSYFLKQESIGGGDLKLLWIMGLYLGVWRAWMALLISCFTGMLFVCLMRRQRIPFGPSLAIGMGIMMLASDLL